jgi:autotransporter-associated beta strand protein
VAVGQTTAGDASSAFLALAQGVTMARDVTINSNASPSGTVKIGSVHTSGLSTFAGAISLGRAAELDVAPGGTTSLTGVVSGAGALIKVNGGTAVLTGANTFAGGIVVDAGALVVTQGGATGTGPIRVNNGATLTAAAGMAGPIVTTALTLAGNGTVDLNDNDLIVDYTGASPLSSVNAAITNARHGGAWDRPGITSTSAKTGGGFTTLAAVEATDLGASSFDSIPVDGTAVLVKYTYYGDLNLDGKIDGDDFTLMDRGFAKHLTGWVNGDVNSDGSVTTADYLLMDAAYGHQSGGVLSPDFLATRQAEFGSAYVSALVAAVPEPTSLGLIAAGAVGLLGRRRRRHA